MSNIVILKNAADPCATYAEALSDAGHAVKIIRSDIEAMDFLVRQRKAPDIVILDMRWPGSAEMVVMGAVRSLSHLSHTKLLVIRQNSPSAPSDSPPWTAELSLSAPVSPDEIKHAVHALTTHTIIARPQATDHETRVWWEGAEAVFIRWTDQALVLAWPDATDTAVKIPRGAVVRLMNKGVLHIDGSVPTWVPLPRVDLAGSDPASIPAEEAPSAAFSPAEPAASEAKAERPNKPVDKLGAVSRLIRKLTGGGGDSARPYGPSRAAPGS
jgi:CheY-like chemotaxis protein